MIRKNDKIRLTITDMGAEGEGIGKYADGGLVFFVKNAVIGDEVLAVVTKMKKGYGYAKVLEIQRPSPYRVQPACPLAERCGGCQIIQIRYDRQLLLKEDKVREHLARIAGQTCEDFRPIIGQQPLLNEQQPREDAGSASRDACTPLHFRNKMQLPVGWDREGHVVTGFYAGHTHYIVAAENCLIAPEVNRLVLAEIRAFLERSRLSAYQEETGTGLIRHVLLRSGFYTGQIMVCLVINGDSLGDDPFCGISGRELHEHLVIQLTKLELPDPWRISSICLNRNVERTNVILGDETRCLYGQPYIEEEIHSAISGMRALLFRINPRSFFQTNPAQTTVLYDTALAFAGLTGQETVWDLYCGIGTISLFLAQKARRVFGVEIVPEAIEDARANAKRNGITNAQFFCGKSEEIFPELMGTDVRAQEPEKDPALPQEAPKQGLWSADQMSGELTADVVVLDPPRKGCDQALLEAIRRVGPERIVYVSCDSATMARDVKLLCAKPEGSCEKDMNEIKESSYQLVSVQAVDMFPQTVHVECVVLLSRL